MMTNVTKCAWCSAEISVKGAWQTVREFYTHIYNDKGEYFRKDMQEYGEFFCNQTHMNHYLYGV